MPVRSKDNFLVFGQPLIEDAEINEVVDSLRNCWLGTGPKVARFEQAFADYRQAAHAIAVHSCTAALHLSLLCLELEPGDEVITPALTFAATANAVIHAGATPVLADVDPVTMNIDLNDARRKLTPRSKAILPVHFAGRPCDMNALCAFTREHGLKMVEDCAHAIEAEYEGRPLGTFGDFGCFSFYVTKNMTTGEGGIILTANKDHAERIRMMALHGLSSDAWQRFSDTGYKHYFVEQLGFKYNMMDLQAAMGLHQLQRVEKQYRRRKEIWQTYSEALAALPVILPAPPEPRTRHGLHLFTLLIDEARTGVSRDTFLERMTAHNIGVGVHYLSLPEHPYYQRTFGWSPQDTPKAARIGRQTVSLPLSAKLSDADVRDVIQAVRLSLSN